MQHADAKRLPAAALLVLCMGAPPAFAKSITINMTTTVRYDADTLAVDLKVSNSGDEAAQSVVAVVRIGEHETRGTRREALVPNGHFDESLSVGAPGLGEGRWPFRVAVDYTDANQYPFEALHVALLPIGNPTPAKLAVPSIDIPPVSTTGTVRLRVKNLAGVARSVAATVFVPGDLEVTDPPPRIELAPWEEKDVRAGFVNRTALAGSRYPIFVALEYDEGGAHQAILAQNVVEIRAARAWLSTWLLWAGGVLVVGWLALLAFRRPRRA